MSARLIGITQPVIDGVATADDLIAYTARVSNPSNQMNTETAPNLIRYLIKNHHWSPFEMVSATIEIKTTRDISRQILRHRSFSFQEFSQRYAVSEAFVNREARFQDPKNRQNSIDMDYDDKDHQATNVTFLMHQRDVLSFAKAAYNWALDNGIAKEQARALLPEGLTATTLYMSGTLRSWLHYIALRAGNGTQKEHRLIALDCLKIIAEAFPSLRGHLSEMVKSN
mgnify:CR=1 FL=1